MGLNLEPGLKSFGETDPNHELTHIISHPEHIVQMIRIVEKTFIDRYHRSLGSHLYRACWSSLAVTSVLLAIARQTCRGFLDVVGHPLHDSPQKRLISNL